MSLKKHSKLPCWFLRNQLPISEAEGSALLGRKHPVFIHKMELLADVENCGTDAGVSPCTSGSLDIQSNQTPGLHKLGER